MAARKNVEKRPFPVDAVSSDDSDFVSPPKRQHHREAAVHDNPAPQ
jgi:hypothetical protein